MKIGFVVLTFMGAVALAPTGALAQNTEEHDVLFAAPAAGAAGVFEQQLPAPPPGAPANIQYFSTELNFGAGTVKGAPYSAEAVTEIRQVLSDGNRITNKNSALVYRDSAGRTRREQKIGAIGPLVAGPDAPSTVFINDPVAGTNYVLDPQTHTAHKMMLPPAPPEGAGVMSASSRGVVFFSSNGAPPPPPPPPGALSGFAVRTGGPVEFKAQVRTESLGTQLIEGVQAEGTRTVRTIPAGEIGNDKPIEIVDERWYSAQLQTVVMNKHTDPRMGETTYKLTNLSLNEPPRSLFEVPADYSVAEDQPGLRVFKRAVK